MPFLIFIILSLFVTVGCGPGLGTAKHASSNQSAGTGGGPVEPPDEPVSEDLGVCGPLPFENVKWPKELSFEGRRAFANSLNITGSFEGNQLWSTIADNSDGQGVSLGLLQQNLGQGTLQPMLIRIREESPELLTQLFSASDRTSLLQMLSAWESTIAPSGVPDDELFPDLEALSPLDETPPFTPKLTTRNAASVAWATKALYSNKKFITRWKKSLMELAATAAYRSLQIEQAMTLFNKAEAYFSALKFREQRSFFLMYDFVVQNGGFNSSHRSAYDKYLKANPSATETAKAKKLLEIRLTSVIAKYRADVRSRKNTIIDGVGTVHGRRRNLPKENCYNPNEILASLD